MTPVCLPSDWTQTLAALLTPTVAIAAVLIATWQAITARRKLRLDLFDKRYQVYWAAQHMVGRRLTRRLSDDEMIAFYTDTAPRSMLFNQPFVDVIDRATTSSRCWTL